MLRLFSTALRPALIDLGLLLLRLGFGGMMLTHGLPKFSRLSAGNMDFADPMGIGEGPSLYLTVFAEVFCALLLMLGAGTRIAAFLLVFTMAVVVFVVHGDDPFGDKEHGLMYLVVFLVLMLAGAGKYSLDALSDRWQRTDDSDQEDTEAD